MPERCSWEQGFKCLATPWLDIATQLMKLRQTQPKYEERDYKQPTPTTSLFIQHLLSVYQDLTVPMDRHTAHGAYHTQVSYRGRDDTQPLNSLHKWGRKDCLVISAMKFGNVTVDVQQATWGWVTRTSLSLCAKTWWLMVCAYKSFLLPSKYGGNLWGKVHVCNPSAGDAKL